MNKIFKSPFFYKNNNGDQLVFLIIMIIIIQEIYNDNTHSPNITLIIKSVGYINIFGHQANATFDKKNFPSLIKINGFNQYIVDYVYYFMIPNNTIELFWNNNSIDCKYMFNGCKDILEINFTNFDTKNVKDMSYMFSQCDKLTSLDLSNFYTPIVHNMSYMFSQCGSLISLDLSNFYTPNVLNMSYMFSQCESLISLNLSNFYSSSVKDVSYMFRQCGSLISLNLSNFKTSYVHNMSYMFSQCKSLASLDLSKFDTKNVKDMSYMFSQCDKLTSLDLSNFYTPIVHNMSYMFSQCGSLISLDLSNFYTPSVLNISYMFSQCGSLISLNLTNFDTSKVIDFGKIFDGCKNLEYINLKNFLEFELNKNKLFFNQVPNKALVFGKERKLIYHFNPENKYFYSINCSDDWQYKRISLLNNISYNYIDIFKNIHQCCSKVSFEECQCLKDEYLTCSTIALELELCNESNDTYYPKQNDTLNYTDYIVFFNLINEHKLNIIDLTFKKCFYTCETCKNESYSYPNNNLICNNDYPEITINNSINISINCYINCTSYYYFKNENNQAYGQENFCPKEYPIFSSDKNKCIKNDFYYLIQNIKQFYNDNDKYKKILNTVETIFTSENYDTSKIDNGENEIINIDDVRIILRTLNKTKKYTDYGYTNLDLRECEDILRNNNNISKGEILYLKQIEIKQDGLKIKKIQYDIYSRLSKTHLTKLNLAVCGNIKLTLSVRINISENLDILNLSSGYYNDVCYTTTSDTGTDIVIKDRQSDFKEGKKIICQEDCDFSSYDFNTREASCSCFAKQSSPDDMKIDTGKIYKKFIDISNIANIKLLKCHHVLFSKRGIMNNIAFYLISTLIIFHIVTIIIFFYRFIKVINDKIKDISFAINFWYLLNENEKIYTITNVKKSNHFFRYYLNDIMDKLDDKISPNEKSKETNLILGKNKVKVKKKISPRVVTTQGIMSKEEIKRKVKEIMALSDEEMNNLSYILALKIDNRKYWEYYLSLLKTNQILFFTFCNMHVDYNSKIIKINLFFVGFIAELFVNALFFNDDTMHKIYEDEGKFNFLYQLTQILYSTLISKVFSLLLNKFALSEGNILDFKESKIKKHLNQRVEKLYFCLRVKFILYFITSSIFMIFFWYYLSMFCAIYRNTQSHLFTDTLLSFALSLMYPFVIYLLPGIFRMNSLSNKEGKKKYIYNFSIYVQNVCSILI